MKTTTKTEKDKYKSLRKAYHDTKKEYRKVLIRKIVPLIRKMLPEGATELNIEPLYKEGMTDRISKYGYVLNRFAVKDGKLSVTGTDLYDEDHEWEFSERDFTTDELEKILDMLTETDEAIESGDYFMNEDGTVTTEP